MEKNLKAQTITGISWSAISQVVNQGFIFVISIVLARILGPAVYGLIGMITVFTGFAAVFGNLALGAAIIQRKDLEERHLNAAFWSNLTMGTTLTIIMAGIAPILARFYEEPALLMLTAVIAFKYIIDSLYVVQLALLQRSMRFKAMAGIQIGSNVISGLVGIAMALCGMRAWSLVAQTLGASIALTIISWRVGGWCPHFSFEFRAFKELFGFSAYALGFDIVNYWARSLDQLLIGRFVGASALGIYSRAYHLMLMPLTQVSQVLGRVMFPALSSIQDDKPRVKRAYLKATSIIAIITFPMMTGLFAVSDHFILALLGQKWADVIPVLKIFCWVGMIQSIFTTVGWLYMSQGRTGLYFVMGLVNSAVIIIAFIIGIHWSIMGVAWAYSIAILVLWCPSCIISGRLIGITFFELLRNLAPPFLCALSMGVVIWAVDWFLPMEMAHWLYLAILIPLGVLLYLALVMGFRLESWQEGRQVFSNMVGERLMLLTVFRRRFGLLRGINVK